LYEEQGPAIIDQQHGPLKTWMRQRGEPCFTCSDPNTRRTISERRWKACSAPANLARAELASLFRPGIPCWSAFTFYKTAHHLRLETDYKQLAIDAAPTLLKPHMTSEAVELVDGGVCANNPIGVAAIEAVGMLVWPADRLNILSIGTTSDVKAQPRWKGKLPMATSVARLFMAGQSHGALGTAKIITGDGHDHKAIWRVDQVAPEGRYTLDNAARIAEMKDRAIAEAREQLPVLRREFFQEPAPPFMPFHSLKCQSRD
jgi:hypothetical protein